MSSTLIVHENKYLGLSCMRGFAGIAAWTGQSNVLNGHSKNAGACLVTCGTETYHRWGVEDCHEKTHGGLWVTGLILSEANVEVPTNLHRLLKMATVLKGCIIITL